MGGAAENKQWAWIECGMCPQEELASPKASPPQLNPQGLRASLHEARTTSLQPPDQTPVDVVAPVHSPGWAVGMGRPRAEELGLPAVPASAEDLGFSTEFGTSNNELWARSERSSGATRKVLRLGERGRSSTV